MKSPLAFPRYNSVSRVLAACAAVTAVAHMPYPVEYERAVREADVVVIAAVMSSVEKRERCETTVVDRLRVERMLKGSFTAGGEVEFSHSIFHWREADWPWQKECPSVHFLVPPRVKDARPDDRVIATLRRSRIDERQIVSGTIAIA